MEAQLAVAKIQKYATSYSGDTVEVIERPHGGISIVLADGQSSGRGAKAISTLVVRKVISLIAEGVRDGAAARAASDSLFTEKGGKASSTLNIISIDQHTGSLLITQNSPTPAILIRNEQLQLLNKASQPLGLYRNTRPVITEISLEPGIIAIAFSDGLEHAGARIGKPIDIVAYLRVILSDNHVSAQWIADYLLSHALELDEYRPTDDISVIVVKIVPQIGDEVRRMTVRLPLSFYNK